MGQPSLRMRIAALAGRWAARLLRLFGRAGSNVPGRVALRIAPGLAPVLARFPRGVSLVTGTNGKTTTAGMLAAILRTRGWRPAHNAAGANLRTGIVAALLTARAADAAVIEADEATLPWAAQSLDPRLLVVGNFFRDQLDRYGELGTAVAHVRRGLERMAHAGVLVLNADDPLASSLGRGWPGHVWHFGVDVVGGGSGTNDATLAPSDAPRCPACGGELAYGLRQYAHIGHYRCTACDYRRPEPDVSVTAWTPGDHRAAGTMTLQTPGAALEVAMHAPGLYHVYNAAAAAAAALALGTPAQAVRDGLAGFRHVFGRSEWLDIRGRSCCLVLVKNPVGCSLALRSAVADPSPNKSLIFALNDRYADGTDVSWIWDADFEAVATQPAPFRAVWASGRRAADAALRLKYAGVPQAALRVQSRMPRALADAAEEAEARSTVYVLATYTAMLALRANLARRRLVPPMGEG